MPRICHWNSSGTPPFQYCNHVSDCGVQCANGVRNPDTTANHRLSRKGVEEVNITITSFTHEESEKLYCPVHANLIYLSNQHHRQERSMATHSANKRLLRGS